MLPCFSPRVLWLRIRIHGLVFDEGSVQAIERGVAVESWGFGAHPPQEEGLSAARQCGLGLVPVLAGLASPPESQTSTAERSFPVACQGFFFLVMMALNSTGITNAITMRTRCGPCAGAIRIPVDV